MRKPGRGGGGTRGGDEARRHAALYRTLLRVYPAGWRRDVGEEAVATFRDLCRDAVRDGGSRGLLRLWSTTLPRVLWGGIAERAGAVADRVRTRATFPRVRPRGADDPPPFGWAALSAGLVFLLYALTLAPTTAFWDTSEYIASAHILGIPHPPGNPMFVVLARAWELLLAPLGLTTAVRINLLSAFMSASAHGLWFLVVHHILGRFGAGRFFRLTGAFAGVVVSATAFTVWNQSNVNEKVYTVSLLTIALLTWLAFRWREGLGEERNDHRLVLIAFILALSVGNHLMAFLAAPALALFVLLVRPGVLTQWRLYPAVFLAAVAGLSIHLFLPLRAGLDPVINQGATTCESVGGALTSIVTWGRRGCEALGAALTRQQYVGPEGTPGPGTVARQAPLHSQLLNYLQYFDWQWARAVQGTTALFADLRLPFTMLFTGLGVWGAAEHARRDRPTFAYVGTLFATVSVGLVVYLNFEYGYSIPDPFGDLDLHEVRERDYFFLVSFSVWGLWAGIGIAAVWRWLAESVTGSLVRASPVLLVVLLPLVLNASWADRSEDHTARDWAYNLLQSIEPYGVVFTNGDNDTFPLWYLQEVEGIRRDVTVVVVPYLGAPWYPKQLRDLSRPCPDGVSPEDAPTRIVCQRPYVPDGRAVYTDRPDALPPGAAPLVLSGPADPPDRPVLELDDETIDRVATSWFPLDEPRPVQVGPIRPVIPGGQYLAPWQQYALAIVDTAFAAGRPVYWSSSGGTAGSLGLGPYLLRQGVAYRVMDRRPEQDPPAGAVRLPGDAWEVAATGRWVDVERTDTLLNDVFIHRNGLPWWDRWPDATTSGIPTYYGWAYHALAGAARVRGEPDEWARHARMADAWMRLGQ